MATDEAMILDTFHALSRALQTDDWRAAAALCDPVSLRLFREQTLDQFRPDQPRAPITPALIKQQSPDLTDANAERMATEANRSIAERRRNIHEEIESIHSFEELERLSPVELFERWLAANGAVAQLRRFLKRHPEADRWQGALSAVPRSAEGR